MRSYGETKHVSFGGEFSWEILYAVADAYQSHLSGILESVDCVDTAPFYYFCSDVKDKGNSRSPMQSYGEPYHDLYKYDLDISKLHPFPPYKDYYSKMAEELGIKIDRPAVVINNKSCGENEDLTEIANRIEIDQLEKIVNYYKDRRIYYIRPRYGVDFSDEQPQIAFEDKDFLRGFSNVLVDEDLMEEWGVDFNTVQLIAHSLSDRFFSVAGGNAILSSHFGGINSIFVAKMLGFDQRGVWKTGSYLKEISGAKIKGFTSTEELVESFE